MDVAEVKEVLAELKGAFADVKTLADRVSALEAKGEKPDALLAEQVRKADERLDALEAKYQRLANMAPAGSDAPEADDAKARAALDEWLRKGTVEGSYQKAVELKALSVGTPTAGGNLTNPGYLRELQKAIVELSPVRSRARVLTIGGPSVDVPKRTQTTAAAWVTETGQRSNTQQPAYGLVNIAPFELYARVEVSRQLLEDAEFDVAGLLREEFAEQFAVAEGLAFLKGDGSGKPVGLLDATGGVDVIAAQDSTTFELHQDDLFALFYGLKGAYAARADWWVNRATLPLIRKMQDSAGNYLWAPPLAAGDPSTILGRPVLEAPDMDAPASGVFAADKRPVMFGDLRRAYFIVDRVGLSVERDDYTGADNGLVVFRARKRVGGKPMITEAAKALEF